MWLSPKARVPRATTAANRTLFLITPRVRRDITISFCLLQGGNPAAIIGARRHQFYCEFLGVPRSEEHTSELQSHSDLVCRLLLEKKKKKQNKQQYKRKNNYYYNAQQ